MYAVYLAYALGFGVLAVFVVLVIGDYCKSCKVLRRATEDDDEKT